MHKIKNYEENKLNSLKLNLILTQMGFFNDIKKKVAFTIQSFSNKKNKQEKTSDEENSVDFHLELTKKIDDIIEKNKTDDQWFDKKITPPSFVEIRQQSTRMPQMPVFQTDLGSKTEIEDVQEFIEIEPTANFLTEKQQENQKIHYSWITSKQNENDIKKFLGLGALKIKIKPREQEKKSNNKNIKNNLVIELEETKKEIEKKKKELEEAIKKEKLKELEIKRQEKEKRKQEKLKKLEFKKKLKEEKIKEKLTKKAKKQKEKELKKQELLKIKEAEKKEVKEEKISPEIKDTKEEQDNISQQNLIFDEDVAKLLPVLDNLFEKLPEETVDEFVKSEYFELYEKVLLKYKNKG